MPSRLPTHVSARIALFTGQALLRCPIRILIPSIRDGSGITTYALSLAAGLVTHGGHEAVLLDETGEVQPPHPRVQVESLGSPMWIPGPLGPLGEWRRGPEVGRIARELEVDGVHATRLGLLPLRGNLAITAWDPIVSPLGRLRAARARGEGPVREATYGVLDAVAALRSNAIVAVTPAVREGLRRFGNCEFVPPFIADDQIAPAIASRPADVVLVAGTLDMPRKGLDLALEAVATARVTAPELRLILVGDWEDDERRRSLPDFCEARGRLTPEEVRDSFRSAGCCLIPSLWEEFGYSGLEALAAGVPLACAPLPGFEGLSGGGVFMAETRGGDDLARQIVAALEVPTFEFPSECRSSEAIRRITALYEIAFV